MGVKAASERLKVCSTAEEVEAHLRNGARHAQALPMKPLSAKRAARKRTRKHYRFPKQRLFAPATRQNEFAGSLFGGRRPAPTTSPRRSKEPRLCLRKLRKIRCERRPTRRNWSSRFRTGTNDQWIPSRCRLEQIANQRERTVTALSQTYGAGDHQQTFANLC